MTPTASRIVRGKSSTRWRTAKIPSSRPSSVDISEEFDTKLAAIRCYASQFEGASAAGEVFPTGQNLYDLIQTQSAHYGSLIRVNYGEPYMTHETVRVDDVIQMPVQSM